MLSGSEDGGVDPNLVSWKILSVSATHISIEVEFKNPLRVSQGDSPDQLAIQAGLSKYPDEYKQRLPKSVVRVKDIPLQFASLAEAEAASDTAFGASSATVAVGTI